MKIGNVAIKCIKAMFKNPSREGAKLYEQIPFFLATGYTGYNIYKAIDDTKNNRDDESKKDVLNAYTGLATVFGSIFGVGGAILIGGSVKLLCDNAKVKFA